MTPLEHIWNGWRAAYVSEAAGPTGAATAASVFTQILESGLSDEDTHIIDRGPTCFAILNAFPYGTGHLLLMPYREIAELAELTGDESTELWSLTRRAVSALQTAYHPDGVNVGINLGRAAGGSVSEHLHVHALPRWVGDGNFMTAIANARTLPEPLVDTAVKLRAAWPGPG